jgi:hypothetical protein
LPASKSGAVVALIFGSIELWVAGGENSGVDGRTIFACLQYPKSEKSQHLRKQTLNPEVQFFFFLLAATIPSNSYLQQKSTPLFFGIYQSTAFLRSSGGNNIG